MSADRWAQCLARYEWAGEGTHECVREPGHGGLHRSATGRAWSVLATDGLTAPDRAESAGSAGKRLSDAELASYRAEASGAIAAFRMIRPGSPLSADLEVIDALFGHIDAVTADLAACRSGRPILRGGRE